MIVTDTLDHLVLNDASNFGALSFATTRPSRTRIDGVAWTDDEHVTIAVDVLRGLAGDKADNPGWAQGFDDMITYATAKGWVDDSGNVRMHVEAPTTP